MSRAVIFYQSNDSFNKMQATDVKNPDAVYLSMENYATKSLEIPRLPFDETRDFIKYRLAKIYPDNSDDIDFTVLHQFRDTGGMAPLLFFSSDLIKTIYAKYPKTAIGTFYNMFTAIPGDFGRIVIFNSGAEAAFFINEQWSKLKSFNFSSEKTETIAAEFIKEVPVVQIIVNDSQYDNYKYLENDKIKVSAISTALDKSFITNKNNYKLKYQKRTSSNVLTYIAGISFIFLLNIFIFIDGLNTSNTISYYKNSILNSTKIIGLADKYNNNFNSRNIHNSKQPYQAIGPYQFLSALYYCIKEPVKITTINLTLTNFSIEGETNSAITILRDLSQSGYFSELKLSGVQLSRDRKSERFSLTGIFNDTP